MHLARPRFVSLITLIALLAPHAAAQDVPSQEELDRRRKELDELKRANDELARAAEREVIVAEATLARLGGTLPWPPADPVTADDAAWRAALLGAEGLSAARAFETAPVLRIQVSRSRDVAVLFADDQDLTIEAVAAVHRAGRRTHPDRVLTLHLGVGLVGSDQLTGEARLTLPARVLRGTDIQHAQIELASFVDVRTQSLPTTRADVLACFDRTLSGLFVKARSSASAPVSTGAWEAWLGDAARAAERRTLFEASARSEEELATGLEDLAGVNRVIVLVPPAAGAEASLSATRSESLRLHWLGLLEVAKIGAGTAAAPDLVHEVTWAPAIADAPPAAGGRAKIGLWSRLSLHEADCLAVLDQRWVRVAGASWSSHGGKRALPSSDAGTPESDEAVAQLLRESALETLEQLRAARAHGSQPAVPPHPDGEAVAAFLRTRARLEVPGNVLADYSNLIARTLAEAPGIPASLRGEWFLQIDGRRQYFLPYVGGARSGTAVPRSVQSAVRAAIDRIVLADPVAGIAFYDIWMHDRGYRRPLLPDDFAAALRAPRPSGAGALRNVAVVDAYEFAGKCLSRTDAPRGGALDQALISLRAGLAGARVLECEYIPEDASTSYTLVRSFWYRSAPADWSATASRLPADFPLRTTGAARDSAPRTLADAERALVR